MKKILLSLAVIAIVAVGAIGATRSFFSDTETSTGNTFTAGAIDLKIDSRATYNDVAVPGATWALKDLVPTSDKFFNFDDIKPGDEGENTISIHVLNNDAYVCAAVSNLTSSDVDQTEPETQAPLDTDDMTSGELDDQMIWTIWKDLDNDGVQDGGGETVLASGNPVNGVMALYDSATGPLLAADTGYLGVEWSLPATSGNETQTDSLTGDISFYTVQSRNNETFRCSDWTPTGEQGGEQEPKVGAKLSAYVAPVSQACNATVSGVNSIQTAIDAASAGQTVCVDNTYTGVGDNVAIQVNKDITLAATTQGVNLDVPVALAADGVTVTGFDGVIGTAGSSAEQAAFYVLGATDNFEISFNTVNGGTGAGILTETGGTNNGGLIANNTLSGATQGIYLNPHTGTIIIEKNDIDNNVAGIGGLMGATVRYNEFGHTTPGSEAMGVDSLSDTNPATVHFNNFLNGTKLNDYGAAVDVNAENNFWNTGGVNQTTVNEVDFTPETLVLYVHN